MEVVTLRKTAILALSICLIHVTQGQFQSSGNFFQPWWFAPTNPPPRTAPRFAPITPPPRTAPRFAPITPPPRTAPHFARITPSRTPRHFFTITTPPPPPPPLPPTRRTRFSTTTRRTPIPTRPVATEAQTVGRFSAGTKAPVVNPDVFEEPNCFAQPDCTAHFKQRYAFVGGICNNPVDKNRGRGGRAYKRLLPADYGDGKGSPRASSNAQPLPSARNISRTLNFDDRQIRSVSISHMMPFWGQFITHETTKAPRGRKPSGAAYPCDCEAPDENGCHNIQLEKDDVRFIKEAETCIEVERTQHVPDPECDASIREQKNEVSSFLDAGLVYGNSESDMDKLQKRHTTIGELLVANYLDSTSDAGLPFQTQVHRDFGGRMQCEVMVHKPPTKPCLLAGDTRANENTGLSANHVLLLRMHNKVIKELKSLNSHWQKDTLVRETKAIITAIFQLITYSEFLPIVIGEKFMKRFNLNLLEKGYWYGYDASVDATLSNSFGAAAFRFGHTTVTKHMSRPSPDWHTKEADPLRVKDSYFNNEPLLEKFHGGVNSVLRGLAQDASQHTGIKMIEDMREFLFATNGRSGRDLFAINIQRGRDHGLPSYNEFRELCGLKKASGFFDMPEIPRQLQEQLASLYKHVDDIDLYIGGLAETAVEGGSVGPTYACIIGYQFRDMRHGDKFWFENGGIFSLFSVEQLNSIRKFSLARLMCDTMSDLRTIQPKPMLLSSVQGNARKFCSDNAPLSLEPWKESRSSGPAREKDLEHDTEWTVWLPCVTSGGGVKSVATTLNDALRFQPDDVCRDIISSETRVVNSVTQVRFECPRGSLKRTDFPYIDSGYEVFWTQWKDESSPSSSNGNDEEGPPGDDCKQPLAIQAQTRNDVPARETGDVFESFNTLFGFVCRGSHQPSRVCKDYRVRYLCRRENIKTSGEPRKRTPVPKSGNSKTSSGGTTENSRGESGGGTPKSDPNGLVWTPWINMDTPTLEGDTELLRVVADQAGFCKNPLYIDARTVDTLVRARESGDELDQFSQKIGLICTNSKQIQQKCHDYEVRYLCRNGDVNEDKAPPPNVKANAKEYCQSYGVCC